MTSRQGVVTQSIGSRRGVKSTLVPKTFKLEIRGIGVIGRICDDSVLLVENPNLPPCPDKAKEIESIMTVDQVSLSDLVEFRITDGNGTTSESSPAIAETPVSLADLEMLHFSIPFLINPEFGIDWIRFGPGSAGISKPREWRESLPFRFP